MIVHIPLHTTDFRVGNISKLAYKWVKKWFLSALWAFLKWRINRTILLKFLLTVASSTWQDAFEKQSCCSLYWEQTPGSRLVLLPLCNFLEEMCTHLFVYVTLRRLFFELCLFKNRTGKICIQGLSFLEKLSLTSFLMKDKFSVIASLDRWQRTKDLVDCSVCERTAQILPSHCTKSAEDSEGRDYDGLFFSCIENKA